VQKLQMSCEVKCALGVQDEWISWQRRERCGCSWCTLHATGELEAVITLVAVRGSLCIGSSRRGRCNVETCRFVLASLTTPVIMIPCVVAGSSMIFGSFGSIAVVTRSLMEGAKLVHVP